ncbi:hypothetical protein [Xanthobacter sp. KR7-225]|uniref:hypothetical protein n=1 Tax=Xanthobacter sp. KR7-225 TaxID=3156613 RepID=UPI0032B5C67E
MNPQMAHLADLSGMGGIWVSRSRRKSGMLLAGISQTGLSSCSRMKQKIDPWAKIAARSGRTAMVSQANGRIR